MGKISGVFGIKGWVKVHSFTNPHEDILHYPLWILKKDQQTQQVNVVNGRRQGKTVIACLAGVTDRDIADTYCGWQILINKNQLIANDNAFYWADIVGLNVETQTGVALGIVDHLIATGANDVLVVKDAKNERLIPFLQGQTIKKIDLNNQRIIVDWYSDF